MSNNKDAHLIKILSELGLRDEPELTPEQEDQFRAAYDPEFKFQKDLERIFNSDSNEE